MNFPTRSLVLIATALLLASTAKAGSIADALNGQNKIWVVVLVLATIFAGILLFLVYLDRRIARLERDSEAGRPAEKKAKVFENQP